MIVSLALVMLSGISASASQPPGFVYALNTVNGGVSSVYGFRLSVISGAMTPLPGSPWTTPGQTGSNVGTSEMLAYGNGRLFVINDGTDTLTVFNVNQVTGALTEATYSPIALGAGDWACLAVHPSGSPVLVGSASIPAALASFVVTSTSATAAAGSPFATGAGYPYSCAFSRDGNYVYTGGAVGNPYIAGFAVAPATGVLTALPGSPFDSGNEYPAGYATDSTGRLFVANFIHAELRVFTTSGGVPTGVSGNPFPSGAGATGTRGLLHPAGFYVGASPSGVAVYQIAGSGSSTTLSPVSGSPFIAGGFNTTTLALSQDGSLLVAGYDSTRSLSSFSVNPATGALTTLSIQNADTLGSTGVITGLAFVPGPTPGDFDDDAKAEIAVFRPATSEWFRLLSGMNYATYSVSSWGNSTDSIVPADYDADGRTDLAVYRPSTGTWYIAKSSTNYATFDTYVWGNSTDVPVPGDYDADGKADPAVFRPSTGQWFIRKSSTNYSSLIIPWGGAGDIAVPGDYDGDRKIDPAVFRPSLGTWFILKSSTAYTAYATYAWGAGGDVTVPGDYDGDGKTDLAVFRPSTAVWYVLQSSVNYTTSFFVMWGLSTDIAAPGDYDGDGKIDIAVFRRSTGVWYVLTSTSNYITYLTFTWGTSGDIPILRRQ